ncbi:hypothetical protein SAMN04488026_102731 [Aliiruegeria lutimaris]|uniref:Uncharacterized protein n=1 Tax=Aliiruegeria lutimaris TaxID=571298 RepID=A0A1G8XUR8_9RHOB|nr:hypothetical protein SAMN04488026_102731 [Aliiruegeria lutimaris]
MVSAAAPSSSLVSPQLTRSGEPDAPERRSDIEFRRSVLLPGSFGSAATPSSSLVSPHLIPAGSSGTRESAAHGYRKPVLLPGFSAFRRRHLLLPGVAAIFFIFHRTKPNWKAALNLREAALNANIIAHGKNCIAALTILRIVQIRHFTKLRLKRALTMTDWTPQTRFGMVPNNPKEDENGNRCQHLPY